MYDDNRIIRTKTGAVDCAEVERVIATFEGIAQVAVIGIPHARLGEAVHAIVVPYAGKPVTAQEVMSFCRNRISDYKCPRSVTIRTDPLPRAKTGEILRSELRKHYWTSAQ